MDGPLAIGQIALPVQDVERATAFYRDVVGLEFLFSAPPGLVFFQCGEVRIISDSSPASSSASLPPWSA